MDIDLLIYNIGQLATLAGPIGPLPPGPRRGAAMRELGIIEDGAIAIADGRVVATGTKVSAGAQANW
jgi:imidazolonepropionase